MSLSGTVQGVGFRPFVHGLARRLQLAGFVRNDGDGVVIEVEGAQSQLTSFVQELKERPPRLARIEHLQCAAVRPKGEQGFHIQDSKPAPQAEALFFTPDIATCDDCLAELTDPNDRRFRYPFISCAVCGPRLTITRQAPYDRARTTMAAFLMCPACRAEFEDPTNRRFHAQPIACAVCGPVLSLSTNQGSRLRSDPLSQAVRFLRDGQILAVKGLGGYHLACDATNEAAVERLRARKRRDEKPFAVMIAGLDAATALSELSPEEARLLTSSRRPIVLVHRRAQAPLAAAVAPGNPRLGLMLPYTPLHHLLAREVDRPLVMTSGNLTDEPIAFEDADAFARLDGVVDAFLTHDRPIHVRCDDSVAGTLAGKSVVFRRSRGYAPEAVRMPVGSSRRLLALGGHLKNTFAVGRGRNAFLSHHLGDLGDHQAYVAYRQAIAHYECLYGFAPELLIHDLHPGYATTEYARERASSGLPTTAIQHHHAHMASCMADNGLDQPVIGVTFDGTGYGEDGSLWGGEFLVGDYRSARRAAHLRCVPLPGGEAAVREPWRMALAHLLDAGLDPAPLLSTRVDPRSLRLVERMVVRRLNSPMTSSAGRLFDAAASLLGVCDRAGYEGQAAMKLEWLAEQGDARGCFPYELVADDNTTIADTRPLVRALVAARQAGEPIPCIARRFHTTLVELIVTIASRLRADSGLETVVLSGGVFMNGLLLRDTRLQLEAAGFRTHCHRQVPPNDGGLSLGQLAVASAQLEAAH